MRFPSYEKKPEKEYKAPLLNGGLAISEDPSVLDSGHLSNCKNVWLNGGLLTTRFGAYASADDVICDLEGDFLIKPLTFTDAFVTVSGESCRIAYCITSDYMSYGDIRVFTVTPHGVANSIGAIHFSRVSSDSFPIPESVYFVVGDGKTGCGIYAFVTSTDYYDYQDIEYGIYECSTGMTSWNFINRNDFYTPIIYINGRGNNYSVSPDPYTPEPRELEAPNLLSGAFKAFFSSDGYSSSYELPVSELDANSNFICRIYTNHSSYSQWSVSAGSDSDTINFQGVNITIKCNRSTGTFRFYSGAAEFAVPRMPDIKGNNICILAYKTQTGGFAEVVGSKNAIVHNSRVYVCDNKISPNTVCSARLTNLLYFPSTATVSLGDPSSAVTAMGIQNDKLVAFKNKGIHRIIAEDGGRYGANLYIPERGKEIAFADKLTTVGIHTDLGCDCPKTLKLCGSRLVWLNSNGSVYVLATTTYGKENNAYDVSSAVSDALKSYGTGVLKDAFAAEHDGYYMLFLGDIYESQTAFVMDYRVKSFGQSSSYLGSKNVDRSLAWYKWQFPAKLKISSVAGFYNGFALAMSDTYNSILYLSHLTGDKDISLNYAMGTVTAEETEIESEFSTKLYDFDIPHCKKDILKLFLTAYCKGDAVLSFFNEDGVIKSKKCRLKDYMSTVSVTPDVNAVNRVGITLSSNKKIAVAPPVFRYRVRVGN